MLISEEHPHRHFRIVFSHISGHDGPTKLTHNPFTSFTESPQTPPLWEHQSALCVYDGRDEEVQTDRKQLLAFKVQHRDIVNTVVVTIYGARWVLEILGRSLCKVLPLSHYHAVHLTLTQNNIECKLIENKVTPNYHTPFFEAALCKILQILNKLRFFNNTNVYDMQTRK